MADYELFQIEVSKKYGLTEWRNDLKSLLRKAGEQGKNVVFLFCDHQIKDEAFLEDINMLLNSGDIPSLFENEERLEIIEHVGSKFFIKFYILNWDLLYVFTLDSSTDKRGEPKVY